MGICQSTAVGVISEVLCLLLYILYLGNIFKSHQTLVIYRTKAFLVKIDETNN